ncbi:MAG: hypothetical protein EGP07_05415 [SAR202 cluster bacterium]|jgi:hypothetical protein|nr:MAG: hypothetical protein EGP07_05415 [SAR202 cluster bacterium]KAA1301015.1 MAG: hypothetical protein EGP04_07245 [SAR202 cluster bacterium]MCH2530475.1 hypothetical protein [Dehalococcoidia bacterium]MQG90167.1 hypothetical protein [SAR202 cluster bacterium]GIT18496.1 MAG: hypothetical protein CM1200mP39_13020 [Dehalococcoidia bacterium]|tara:strand:- start:923 stop:1153 length:231 start_codon:yes stop_codon:yes gene_type:complete
MRGAKTKKMVLAERKLRRPLEKALPEIVNDVGLTGAAKRLGVSKATLSYWLLKLDIKIERVALAPGEEIEIRRVSN